MLLSAPWKKVNRGTCKSKEMERLYKFSYHWILQNWLVLMYPEEFPRPVKQKVLAQAMHSYGGAFPWKHLLAFMHMPWPIIHLIELDKFYEARLLTMFLWHFVQKNKNLVYRGIYGTYTGPGTVTESETVVLNSSKSDESTATSWSHDPAEVTMETPRTLLDWSMWTVMSSERRDWNMAHCIANQWGKMYQAHFDKYNRGSV